MHLIRPTLVLSFLCLICMEQEPVQAQSIVVKASGMVQLRQGDVAMQFFATVENSGNKMQTLWLQMTQCCQQVDKDKDATDCESIKLSSLLPLDLYPGDTKNFTLFFPNKYLDQRQGFCSFHVHGSDEHDFKIVFNRTSENDAGLFEKYFSGKPVTEEFDQNVNCLVKYGGFNSWFDPAVQKCQETPVCDDEYGKGSDLGQPKNMISPITNKCKNIGSPMLTDAMTQLRDVTEIGAFSYQVYPMKISCVHGSRTNTACDCHPGWYSNPFPVKTFNMELDTYQMCNVRAANEALAKTKSSQITTLFILIFLVSILCLVLCLFIPFYCRKLRKDRAGKKLAADAAAGKAPSHSSSNTITEVKNRREVILPPTRPFQTKTEVNQMQLGKGSKSIFGNLAQRAKSFDAISRKLVGKPKLSESDMNDSEDFWKPEVQNFERIEVTKHSTKIKIRTNNPTEMESQALYAATSPKDPVTTRTMHSTETEIRTSDPTGVKSQALYAAAVPKDTEMFSVNLTEVAGPIISNEELYTSPQNSNKSLSADASQNMQRLFNSMFSPKSAGSNGLKMFSLSKSKPREFTRNGKINEFDVRDTTLNEAARRDMFYEMYGSDDIMVLDRVESEASAMIGKP